MTESWHTQEKLLKVECVEGKTGDRGGEGCRVDNKSLTPNQELGFYLEGAGKLLRGRCKDDDKARQGF